MNKQECLAVMAMLRANYSKFCAFDDDEARRITVNLWAKMFADVPFETAKKSALNYIATHHDTPTISDILGPCTASANPEDGWLEIKQAARKADQYAQWRKYPMIVGWDVETNLPLKSNGVQELHDLFESLSPAAQEFVGSPDRLIDMGRNGLDEYQHSAFIRAANVHAEEHTYGQIEAAREQKQLEGGASNV